MPNTSLVFVIADLALPRSSELISALDGDLRERYQVFANPRNQIYRISRPVEYF
jgi:hypothetical protein